MDSIEELLDPIPGDDPSGENQRYSPAFDRIRDARREDPDLAQGMSSHIVVLGGTALSV